METVVSSTISHPNLVQVRTCGDVIVSEHEALVCISSSGASGLVTTFPGASFPGASYLVARGL
jgi:hypothetical protein